MRVFEDDARRLATLALHAEHALDDLVWQSSALLWSEPPAHSGGDMLFDWALKQSGATPVWPDCVRDYFVQQRRKLKSGLFRRPTPWT